ncbi:MAG: hypothetical protein HUJ72_04725, partial [Blautia sp.]|nr:hypothetical protein [Blautia sp.]
QELEELDYRRVINAENLMKFFTLLQTTDDDKGFKDVIYFLREIFDFGIEELDDFRWLEGDAFSMYADNFTKKLKEAVSYDEDEESEYEEYNDEEDV